MFDIPIAIRHRVTTGHQPYVSAEENIAELTVRAIVLGLVLGALMNEYKKSAQKESDATWK